MFDSPLDENDQCPAPVLKASREQASVERFRYGANAAPYLCENHATGMIGGRLQAIAGRLIWDNGKKAEPWRIDKP